MELNNSNFSSEGEKVQYTSNQIIIPSRLDTYNFLKGSYNEEMLSRIISEPEFEKLINEASRIMSYSWTVKRKNDTIKTPKSIVCLSILSLILMVTYSVLIYFSAKYKNSNSIFILSIICVSLGSSIALGLAIYNFIRKEGKFLGLDDFIIKNLKHHFNSVNKSYENKLNFEYDSNKRSIIVTILKENSKKDLENFQNIFKSTVFKRMSKSLNKPDSPVHEIVFGK
jgi:hypothetical protein